MILSIISPSFVYPILDAKDSTNWNFTKQTISGLYSRAKACGIENSTSVISGLIQLLLSSQNKKDIPYTTIRNLLQKTI